MEAKRCTGYATNPGHRVDTRPAGLRVRVTVGGETIADTRDAVCLEESGYPPVYYLPRKDIDMARLQRTEHASDCPYKGRASYFSVTTANRFSENAAWSYEQACDEVGTIREMLAFYPNRVDRIEALPA
jgi:uncharacterized protein (DUF427 family)